MSETFTGSRFARFCAAALLALAVTACSSGGTSTSCALDGCTITFPRSGAGEVSVLGVKAQLVGVQGGIATVSIAGNTVQLPVGGQTEADGFTVGVQSVTDTDVVVKVQLAAGG